jgi:hypothetical protein
VILDFSSSELYYIKIHNSGVFCFVLEMRDILGSSRYEMAAQVIEME